MGRSGSGQGSFKKQWITVCHSELKVYLEFIGGNYNKFSVFIAL